VSGFHDIASKGITRELLESLVSDLREIAAEWADGSTEQLTLMVAADTIAARTAVTDEMVNRFLSWPLPASVCSDLIVTQAGAPHRIGTNLLTATEARAMLEHVLECHSGYSSKP
jgi:hypothetical protein